ncbi:sulfur oxidation c-type cytochrome SoxX [bacterium]|nr:sulfur oxidation c-type cytochrome SoxX [bacterium]MBU1884963.1 sulfur oxidation c-type cytochrome SoxX [bacterium]
MVKNLSVSLLLGCSLFAADYSSIIEHPDASEIIKKDLLAPAKVYTMPAGCITTDAAAIARGDYIFHNLNGEKAKADAPAGLSKKNSNGSTKQFGNCVACHNIEGAKGAGNIGPDLHGYKQNFIDSGARTTQFVYQKIADARIDNPDTHMTINLTTKLFNEREICDIASYIVSPK